MKKRNSSVTHHHIWKNYNNVEILKENNIHKAQDTNIFSCVIVIFKALQIIFLRYLNVSYQLKLRIMYRFWYSCGLKECLSDLIEITYLISLT